MACGTAIGVNAHRKRNEPPCPGCKKFMSNPDASDIATPRRKPGPIPGSVPLAPCGTTSAVLRHRKRGETLDALCEQAKDDLNRDRRLARRERDKQAVSLAPCGTYAAASRHERNGDPVDEACLKARREYDNANKKSKRGPRKPPVPCGTPGALARHQRAKEKCQTCTDADNKRARERRARKKAAKQ